MGGGAFQYASHGPPLGERKGDKGFPVGYLLFWENAQVTGARQIGEGDKAHKHPNRLIVDGQQRLTSLYAVFRGKKVLDSDYRERARNPESPSAESLEVQSACSQLPGRRGANDFFLAKGDGMFYICSRHAAENARMSNPGVAKRDAKRPGAAKGSGNRNCAGKGAGRD